VPPQVLLLDQRLAREVLADLEKSEMLREQRDERVRQALETNAPKQLRHPRHNTQNTNLQFQHPNQSVHGG
jgi:hypothetical protein